MGEAGVGKSRLAYEFVHANQTQDWRVLESASVSYGKATPYFPVLDLLERYCHLDERDDPRTMRAKVTGQVLTLDEALQDTSRRCCPSWRCCRTTVRLHPRPTAAPPAHAPGAQAGAAARKPGATAAAGV